MNLFSLSGKRILVTGASSGIGRSCAIMASELGASVVMTARRADALEETLTRMTDAKAHTIIPGDITSPTFIRHLAECTGKIDGLVHAAGVGPLCPIGMMTSEHVEYVMRTNYYAFLEMVKFYSKTKYRHSSMSIVAVSSISSLAGWGGVSAYSGSKGALSASVRALAVELASKGIRVNAVCPGHINTPMYSNGAAAVNSGEMQEDLLRRQPLGLGEPEQVAAPVCFLLCDAANFITGVNLPVDGGYLAQ